MDSFPDNPNTNALAPGVTDEQVLAAVTKSGYPLQTVVSDALRARFHVTEEWSYIDRDSGDLRTMDIHANTSLYDLKEQPSVRPQLDLLVECKQSDLPFVFFLSRERPWLPNFPVVAGLRTGKVTITSDDDPSSWTFSVLHVLELYEDAFFKHPRYCTTFSKCVRKGSDLQLSGVDAYNGLILPLVKAQQHFASSEQPVDTAVYFDLHLNVAIGVVDAPMIAVECQKDTPELKLIPFVRVIRHEYASDAERCDRSTKWAVDIVHKDYFSEYIEKQLLPFAERFSTLALKHQQVLASGNAFVAGMGKNSWTDIEPRLSSTRSAPFLARTRAAAKNLMKRPDERSSE